MSLDYLEVQYTSGDFLPAQVVVTAGSPSLWSRLVAWATGSRWTHVFMVVDPVTGIEAGKGHRVRTFVLTDRLAKLEAEGREWRVLDLPWLTAAEREVVVDSAKTHTGRRYDLVQAILYGLFGRFFRDGTKRVICSRLITASFDSVGIWLFPPWHLEQYTTLKERHAAQMALGYVVPEEFLTYSRLQDVTFRNWRAGLLAATRALEEDFRNLYSGEVIAVFEDQDVDDYPVPAYPLTDSPTT